MDMISFFKFLGVWMLPVKDFRKFIKYGRGDLKSMADEILPKWHNHPVENRLLFLRPFFLLTYPELIMDTGISSNTSKCYSK